jgi:hypothetical protein
LLSLRLQVGEMREKIKAHKLARSYD